MPGWMGSGESCRPGLQMASFFTYSQADRALVPLPLQIRALIPS